MVCEWVAPLADFFFLPPQHSRPQSPSFLLVEWSCPLQVNPSGSWDENGSSRNPSQLQQTFVLKEHVTKP